MNYFETLDVSPHASFEEIKHAYHEQIKLWHPDLFAYNHALRADAEERTKQINYAFKMIELFLSCGALDHGPQPMTKQTAEPVQQPCVPRGRVITLKPQELQPRQTTSFSRYAFCIILLLFSVPLATVGLPNLQLAPQRATTHRLTALAQIPKATVIPPALKNGAEPLREVSIDLPLAQTIQTGPSPLIQSATACNLCQARMLIAQGADVNATDARGESALIWTVKVDCPSVAELLVKNGAEVAGASRSGLSAAAWARNYRNRKLIEIFTASENRSARQAVRSTGSPLSQIS